MSFIHVLVGFPIDFPTYCPLQIKHILPKIGIFKKMTMNNDHQKKTVCNFWSFQCMVAVGILELIKWWIDIAAFALHILVVYLPKPSYLIAKFIAKCMHGHSPKNPKFNRDCECHFDTEA